MSRRLILPSSASPTQQRENGNDCATGRTGQTLSVVSSSVGLAFRTDSAVEGDSSLVGVSSLGAAFALIVTSEPGFVGPLAGRTATYACRRIVRSCVAAVLSCWAAIASGGCFMVELRLRVVTIFLV